MLKEAREAGTTESKQQHSHSQAAKRSERTKKERKRKAGTQVRIQLMEEKLFFLDLLGMHIHRIRHKKELE